MQTRPRKNRTSQAEQRGRPGEAIKECAFERSGVDAQELASLKSRQKEAAPDLSRLVQHRLTLPFAEDLNRLAAAIETASGQGKALETAEQERRRYHLQWIAGIVAAHNFASDLVESEEQALTKLQLVLKEQETQTQEAET